MRNRSEAYRSERPPVRGRIRLTPTVVTMIIWVLGTGGPVLAQGGPPAEAIAGGTVILDFQEAELRVVLAALADLAGMTISYSGLPTRAVTLRSAEPVPRAAVREIFERLVHAEGLEFTDDGHMVRVSAPSVPSTLDGVRSARIAGEPGFEPELFVHRLRHAKAEVVSQTLGQLFDFGGRADGPARVGTDPPIVRPSGSQVEAAGGGAAASPGDPGASGLRGRLTGPVTVVPESLTNSLLIRANRLDYETLKAAVAEIDARPLQVLIEVLIAEVRRDHRFDLGVDVEVPEQLHERSGVTFGGRLEGRSAGDLAVHALGIGPIRAEVALRMLAASDDVTILSRPVLLARNNQPARMMVGTQQPFVQLSRALPTDTAIRDQVVQYRDVGTQLTILPTINPDGYVSLSVHQEVSIATTEVQFGAPIISTREVQTELLVRDGHTVVIGGLVDRASAEGTTGIPILKDLPILGYLFRSTQRRHHLTELFLFLTPHVLPTDEALDSATERLEQGTELLPLRLPHPIPLIPRHEGLPPAPENHGDSQK
jgi:type II secretory pathway component GspD/PulD (secretin)